MISADYCRTFARYNHWQNTSLVISADGLSQSLRWQDRGAFFGSIAATLNHLYWSDALMLERLKGNPRPQDQITHSLSSPSDWSTFKTLRKKRDRQISLWAASLSDQSLTGVLRWDPLDGSDRVEMAMPLAVVQFFNHQTHHRGQIHAMLTAAGARPQATDIALMPSEFAPGPDQP